MLRFPVAARRARLVARHRLGRRPAQAPTPEAGSVEDAAAAVAALAEDLVGLHASDAATPFLAAWARLDGFSVGDLERAAYDLGAVTKHHGMRRTLFVQARAVLPVVQAACTDAIRRTEQRRLAADVEGGGLTTDGARWVASAEAAVVAALDELGPSTGAQLSRAVPALRAKLTYGVGRKWGGEFGVATRVLTGLAAAGRIRRGRPTGAWTSSQHRWELVEHPPAGLTEVEAVRSLVERWLRAFGPAPVGDLVWWTGLGVTKVRRALTALDVVEVDLDGVVGVGLAGDSDGDAATLDDEPAVALLPALDPTTMGWKHRGWYLGEHGPILFDRNGNAGPTIWWGGRIVGGWSQRKSGEVVTRLLEDLGADADGRVRAEAEALETWLGGVVVTTRFPTPLDDELRAR